MDHITVTMCVCAVGKIMPTFLIYGKSLPTLAVKDNLPEGWLHGASPNGGFCQLQWFFIDILIKTNVINIFLIFLKGNFLFIIQVYNCSLGALDNNFCIQHVPPIEISLTSRKASL